MEHKYEMISFLKSDCDLFCFFNRAACGMLVLQPVEPVPPALGVQNLNPEPPGSSKTGSIILNFPFSFGAEWRLLSKSQLLFLTFLLRSVVRMVPFQYSGAYLFENLSQMQLRRESPSRVQGGGSGCGSSWSPLAVRQGSWRAAFASRLRLLP